MRRSDYLACYDAGRRLSSRHFIVFVRLREDGPEPWRVGMAVTKKIGSAVVRNRVKRVLREFFRQHQSLLMPRVDIVVVPKKHLRPDAVTLAPVARDLLPVVDNVRRLVRQAGERALAPGLPDSGGQVCAHA